MHLVDVERLTHEIKLGEDSSKQIYNFCVLVEIEELCEVREIRIEQRDVIKLVNHLLVVLNAIHDMKRNKFPKKVLSVLNLNFDNPRWVVVLSANHLLVVYDHDQSHCKNEVDPHVDVACAAINESLFVGISVLDN